MKIIINQPRASYFVGGGELISFDHAKQFLKLGNDVSFITLRPASVGLNYSNQYLEFYNRYKSKINIIEIQQSHKILDLYKIQPGESRCRWNIESIYYNYELYRFLAGDNNFYDVMLSYYNLDAVFYPKNLVKKNILYLCGYPKQQDDFQGSFLSVYDKVFAISDETQKYWQKYRKERIRVISTGVDYEKFTPSNKRNIGECINILFVGRLIARKNVDKIILAVNELQKKYDITLTVVGDGPEKNFLKNLSQKTIFEGVVANPETYYQNADIFVTPSLFGEGVQGTILEAMSCGLTIVATNSEINKSLLSNGRGFLVEPTIEDIIKGIELAIKADRCKIAKKSRDFIKDNYNWFKKVSQMQREMLK